MCRRDDNSQNHIWALDQSLKSLFPSPAAAALVAAILPDATDDDVLAVYAGHPLKRVKQHAQTNDNTQFKEL